MYIANYRQLDMSFKMTDDIEDDEAQPLEPVDRQIRNYIIENPGITANKVVTYMQEKKALSRIPTLKRISRLESRGIIEDHKEGNSFHRLYVNEKTQFNMIYWQLIQIEAIIDSTQQTVPLHQVSNLKVIKIFDDPSIILFNFDSKSYIETVSTMLRVLLIWTYNEKMLEADKQLLYQKITKLMLKLNVQSYSLQNAKKSLAQNKYKLRLKRQGLPRLLTSDKAILEIKQVDNLIKVIEDFESIIANVQALQK
jgi:hypothetical protein